MLKVSLAKGRAGTFPRCENAWGVCFFPKLESNTYIKLIDNKLTYIPQGEPVPAMAAVTK